MISSTSRTSITTYGSARQNLEQVESGLSAGASVLPRARLLEAALQTGDKILIYGMQGNCDLHSHAMSRAVLTSKPLVLALETLGFTREAVILEILGQSVEAWHMPH